MHNFIKVETKLFTVIAISQNIMGTCIPSLKRYTSQNIWQQWIHKYGR